MTFTSQEIQKLKEKLLAEELGVSETLASFAKKNPNAGKEFTAEFPFSAEAGDEDAQTQAVEEYGTRLSTEVALETRLRAIRKALGKIEKKTFGVCANCGKEIPLPRLEVSPEAEVCGKCTK